MSNVSLKQPAWRTGEYGIFIHIDLCGGIKSYHTDEKYLF